MSEQAEEKYEEFRETFLKIQQEVSKRIVGQKEIIEGVLICLMTGGHALLEGVPGLGKDPTHPNAARGTGPQIFPNSIHARSNASGYHWHHRCR